MDSFNWKQYLQNYPDLKEAGITNCEQAWNHYQRFGKQEGRIYNSIMNIARYSVLYKNTDSYVIDFSNTINYELYGGDSIKMYSSTPCMVKVDDSYILIIRYVNYLIKEYDPYFTYSVNKEIKLDKSFIKTSEHFHGYSFKDDMHWVI